MSGATSTSTPSAFEVVSQLVAAVVAQDTATTESLHAEDYVVDWAYGDAFENPPITAEEGPAFCPASFIGFDDIYVDAIVVCRIVDGRINEAWDIPAINTVRPYQSRTG